MSRDAFVLRVPADPAFRDLAVDVVGRYIELLGGPDAERARFDAALAEAINKLGADPDDVLDLICTTRSDGFDLTIRCGGRSTVVRHPLAAGKS